MSKASEYVKSLTGLSRPECALDSEHNKSAAYAHVDHTGHMFAYWFGERLRLPPDNAVRLAHWILDTFGDEVAR